MNYPYAQLLGLVAPVYAIIVAGLVLRRVKWLTAEADASLMRVAVNVLAPCLIFGSLVGNEALHEPANLILPPLAGFFSTAAGFGAGWLAARAIGLRDPVSVRTFAFVVGICNYSYIPIPIAQGLFDEKTLGVLFTHNVGVDIAFWTLGVLILTGARGGSGWRNALNGPVLAVLAGLTVNLLGGGEWMPQWVMKGVRMLGESAVPMALILIGATLGDWATKTTARDSTLRTSVAACTVRLLVMPIAILLLARVLPCSVELKRVLVLQAAMPCAVFPIVLTKHYQGDTRVALVSVISTSALGLLTIPLWIRLGLGFLEIGR